MSSAPMDTETPIPNHDAAYHEWYERTHDGESCPDCRPWEVMDDDEEPQT